MAALTVQTYKWNFSRQYANSYEIQTRVERDVKTTPLYLYLCWPCCHKNAHLHSPSTCLPLASSSLQCAATKLLCSQTVIWRKQKSDLMEQSSDFKKQEAWKSFFHFSSPQTKVENKDLHKSQINSLSEPYINFPKLWKVWSIKWWKSQ